jgi:ribosomal protein S18 acetylase RimI-like enzyme
MIVQEDLPEMKIIISSTELFPSDLLEQMTAGFFSGNQAGEIWIAAEYKNKTVALAFCAPEKLTDGTYNLYLIAVHKEYQGMGIGSHMIEYISSMLKADNARILIVETSGLAHFGNTRKFYIQKGFVQEAIIHDFYQQGEDKIIFVKKII